jgi:hypothetical protein
MDNFWIINFNEWMKFQVYRRGAAHMITSAMKLSMDVSLFQWSGVSKNPKWKPMINTWFEKFKVSIYINIF